MSFKKMMHPQGLPFTTVLIDKCLRCSKTSIKMMQRRYTIIPRPLYVEVVNPYCINCRLDLHLEDMS